MPNISLKSLLEQLAQMVSHLQTEVIKTKSYSRQRAEFECAVLKIGGECSRHCIFVSGNILRKSKDLVNVILENLNEIEKALEKYEPWRVKHVLNSSQCATMLLKVRQIMEGMDLLEEFEKEFNNNGNLVMIRDEKLGMTQSFKKTTENLDKAQTVIENKTNHSEKINTEVYNLAKRFLEKSINKSVLCHDAEAVKQVIKTFLSIMDSNFEEKADHKLMLERQSVIEITDTKLQLIDKKAQERENSLVYDLNTKINTFSERLDMVEILCKKKQYKPDQTLEHSRIELFKSPNYFGKSSDCLSIPPAFHQEEPSSSDFSDDTVVKFKVREEISLFEYESIITDPMNHFNGSVENYPTFMRRHKSLTSKFNLTEFQKLNLLVRTLNEDAKRYIRNCLKSLKGGYNQAVNMLNRLHLHENPDPDYMMEILEELPEYTERDVETGTAIVNAVSLIWLCFQRREDDSHMLKAFTGYITRQKLNDELRKFWMKDEFDRRKLTGKTVFSDFHSFLRINLKFEERETFCSLNQEQGATSNLKRQNSTPLFGSPPPKTIFPSPRSGCGINIRNSFGSKAI
ncbi:unnamed protein product [Dimorphilus gyrociliatus]|uniref:Uncharacterized protein n=1 Tax=Dimorphilus gyrociliatus TaxID=2664684 RepID=A0A7I8W4C4_9ANNE|nr:unnamed protein product [Dimorphilus gyrociliatus]